MKYLDQWVLNAVCMSALAISISLASDLQSAPPVSHTNQDSPNQGFVDTLLWLDTTWDNIEFSFLTAFLNTPCAEEAIGVCGKGKVCWLCTCWNSDGGGHCSFGCDTGSGCQPAPPCSCHMVAL